MRALQIGGTTLGPTGVAQREPALDRRGHSLDNDPNRFHRVIVAWDRVRDRGRIGIGIYETDARDARAGRLGDSDFVVIHIDGKHRRGQAAHIGDAVEVLLHARHLTLDGGLFLARELGHLAVRLHGLVFLELGH